MELDLSLGETSSKTSEPSPKHAAVAAGESTADHSHQFSMGLGFMLGSQELGKSQENNKEANDDYNNYNEVELTLLSLAQLPRHCYLRASSSSDNGFTRNGSPATALSLDVGPKPAVEDFPSDKGSPRTCSDEDEELNFVNNNNDNNNSRKKLRLSKEQYAFLEEHYKLHNSLNPNQKLALAKQLNLRPRQVEVWFQNRRARTKLKQTEADCVYLKQRCESLTDDNKRLLQELKDLRALNNNTNSILLCNTNNNNKHFPPLAVCPSCKHIITTTTSAAVVVHAISAVDSSTEEDATVMDKSMSRPKFSFPFSPYIDH